MSYLVHRLWVDRYNCYRRVERVLGECEAAWREAVGRAVHARSQISTPFATGVKG
jgi:hypothetical protein